MKILNVDFERESEVCDFVTFGISFTKKFKELDSALRLRILKRLICELKEDYDKTLLENKMMITSLMLEQHKGKLIMDSKGEIHVVDNTYN